MTKISAALFALFLLLSCNGKQQQPALNSIFPAHPDTSFFEPKDTFMPALKYENGIYDNKELNAVMDSLNVRLQQKSPAMEVIIGYGIGDGVININLIYDSPRNRKLVRTYLIDAPFLVFEGPKEPRKVSDRMVADTLGVHIEMKKTVYSTDAATIEATVTNRSSRPISYGDEREIAFLDKQNTWRMVPRNSFSNSMLYALGAKESKSFSVILSPTAFHCQPGKYRFLFNIKSPSGEWLWIYKDFKME